MENLELPQEHKFAIMTKAKRNFKNKYPHKKLYSRNLRNELKTDEYFNTALIKYSYALTCHRAQSMKWNNIFLDCETDQGKENENYFQWIYTAIKCSKNKIYLLNSPKITPYIYLSLAENPKAFDEYLQISPVIALSDVEINDTILNKCREFKINVENKFLVHLFANCFARVYKEKIQITSIEHRQYQEVYSFKDENSNKAKLTFYYNATGQISSQQFNSVTEFSKRIEELLMDNSKVNFSSMFKEKFLNQFYQELNKFISEQKISIDKIVKHNYHYEFHFIKGKNVAIINVFHNKEGFITTGWPTKYNSVTFLAELKKIFEKFKSLL